MFVSDKFKKESLEPISPTGIKFKAKAYLVIF